MAFLDLSNSPESVEFDFFSSSREASMLATTFISACAFSFAIESFSLSGDVHVRSIGVMFDEGDEYDEDGDMGVRRVVSCR